MTKINLTKIITLICLVILGVIYSYFIHIDISNIVKSQSSLTSFDFTINSKISQNKKLHISTAYKLQGVSCNGNKSSFKYFKYFDYKREEQLNIFLKKGINKCILTNKEFSFDSPIVKQKISFIEFLVLFVFFFIPLLHILFYPFIWCLKKIWRVK